MTTPITHINNFDPSLVVFGEPKTTPVGKSIAIKYDDTPLLLSTNDLLIPYQISDFKGNKQYKINLSLDDEHLEVLTAFDTLVIDTCEKNNWIGSKTKPATREVIISKFHPLVRPSKNEAFKPTISLSIFVKDGEVMPDFYDMRSNPIAVDVSELSNVVASGSTGKVLMRLSSVWINQNGFGVSAKLDQFKITGLPQPKIKKCIL